MPYPFDTTQLNQALSDLGYLPAQPEFQGIGPDGNPLQPLPEIELPDGQRIPGQPDAITTRPAPQPMPDQPAPEPEPSLAQRFLQGFTGPEADQRTAEVQAEQQAQAQAAEDQFNGGIRQRVDAADEANALSPYSKEDYGSTAAVEDLETRQLATTQKAADAELAAGKAEADLAAIAASAKLREADKHQERTQSLLKERDARVAERMERLDALDREISNTKIDPDQFWADASVGRQLSMVLSAALGGFLAGHSGTGRNMGLDLANRMIDRSMAAQEANLANKQADYGRQRGLLALMQEQYGDKQAALDAAKAHAWNRIALDTEEQMAKVKGNERFIADGLKFKASAQQKALEHQNAARARIAEVEAQAWEREKWGQQHALARSANSRAWFDSKEDQRHNIAMENRAEMELEVRGKEAEAQGRAASNKAAKELPFLVGVESTLPEDVGPDGKPYAGRAPVARLTDTQRKDAQGWISSANDTQDLIADIEAVGTGRNVINDKDKAIVGAAMARIRRAQQAMVKGIPSDADQKLIDAGYGGIKNPQEVLTFLNDGEKREVLRTALDMDVRGADTQLETIGLKRLPREARPVTREPEKVRARVPEEFKSTLQGASRVPRDVPGKSPGSSMGMRTDFGDELMNLARAGTDTDSARRAYHTVIQQAAPILSNTPQTRADEVLRIEATNAVTEAQRRLNEFSAKDKTRGNNPLVNDILGQ